MKEECRTEFLSSEFAPTQWNPLALAIWLVPYKDMLHARVALGVAVLSLLGCGPSYWRAELDRVDKIQTESKIEQAKATDEVVKFGYLICNAYSVRLGVGIQSVIDARVEEAKGAPEAAKHLSTAEHAVSLVRPFVEDYCALAKKATLRLTPAAPPVSAPVAPVPVPSAPAPTGGTAVPLPAVLPPAASPVVPPVGVSSPSVPVVP